MDLIKGIQAPCGTNLDANAAQLFLMLINTLMGTQCSLGSRDAYPPDSTHKLKNEEEFDFIVVGAGSAGSVLANQLVDNSNYWKILVLEAGDYPSATSEIPALLLHLQQTKEDWQYKTEKSDNSCKGYVDGQCRWPRGKVLGGSSTINAMLYIRGNDNDFDNWERLGNPGWNYEVMKKHFRDIEGLGTYEFEENHLYGKQGLQALSWYDNKQPITKSIYKAVHKYGYNTATLGQNPRKPLGFYQLIQNIHEGVRVNAAKAFLGHSKDNKNLALITNAFVKRLIVDKSSLSVNGVEVEIGGKPWKFMARKEVILSAGALNTPPILMHSGIGPSDHLKAVGIEPVVNLPGVGENLLDHMTLPIFFQVNNSAFLPTPPGTKLDDLYNYFKDRSGALRTFFITNLNGFINTKNDSQLPNIQLAHIAFLKNDRRLLPQFCKIYGFNEKTIEKLLKKVDEDNLVSIQPIILQPKSVGKIQLNSNNVYETPKFYSGYFTDAHGDDLTTMLEGLKFILKLWERPEMQKFNPRFVPLPSKCKSNIDSDEYWKCYLHHFGTTLYHQSGTAKMGPRSDPMTVVDERLRVHGVKNLRIIDASIMPMITSANTNAPCLAIGHKGGTMILEDWKRRDQHRTDEL